MKVLYIDFNTAGHHGVYFRELLKLKGIEPVLVLPVQKDEIEIRQLEIPELSRNMAFGQYYAFFSKLKEIIREEKPDCVHILSGDFLYRYFGFRLATIKLPLLVTFHHVEFSKSRGISYRRIFSKITTGVVHTEYIYNHLIGLGIRNAEHIEYPYMEEVREYDPFKLKEKYHIPENTKVLLSFGETRYDKGLDLLLKALEGVQEDFHLVIAGKASKITEEEINDLTKGYSDRTTKIFGYIEDETMNELFAMCDMVVLPYRRKFAGASGPLTTAVAYGKTVIGPDCNSLGDIIRTNHLGYQFECENVDSLRSAVEKALQENHTYDHAAAAYQKKISKEVFVQEYQRIYKRIEQGNDHPWESNC